MSAAVVVLGGGFGGAYCVRGLERSGASLPDVTLLDHNNFFIFYPLLIEAGTGNLQPSHVVVPIRAFVRRSRFTMAEVADVDFAAREVHYRLETGESLRRQFDHLVIAPGSVTRMPEVPGLREFGFDVKGLADAIRLRDRAIRLVEQAGATGDSRLRRALLHFVVVGANFTGAEVAGEFHQFLRQVARRAGNVDPDECRVTLIERADRILGSLDPELSEFAAENLRRRGVDVRTNSEIERIDEHSASLPGGQTLDTSTVVWCAGIQPNPLLERLRLPKDDRGYIVCDPDLRVQGFPNVWAIGDCAVNRDENGDPYPATAQHAVRQGLHAALNVRAAIDNRPVEPFRYRSQGALAALGCRAGVAKVGPFKVSGFAAWWLHRSAYLLKMPGTARKARVALDWTMDLAFPRDFVSLGLSGTGRHR